MVFDHSIVPRIESKDFLVSGPRFFDNLFGHHRVKISTMGDGILYQRHKRTKWNWNFSPVPQENITLPIFSLCLLTYLFTWSVVPRGPGRASLGNVRSGMSRSLQFWIRQLSHLAAWFIWVALWVLYMALKLSLLSTLFTSAGMLFQSSITRMLKMR